MAGLAVSLALLAGAEPATIANPPSGRSRGSRSKITEAIIATLPKFAPLPPLVSPGSPSNSDSAEDTFKLPKMTIRPTQFMPESDFAWLNTKGRLELARKAHPGIRVGNIFGMNEGIVQAMQQEERLAAKKFDLADRVQRSTLGDSEVDQKIRKLMQALLRRSATEREFP
jgi:hypothetical protein